MGGRGVLDSRGQAIKPCNFTLAFGNLLPEARNHREDIHLLPCWGHHRGGTPSHELRGRDGGQPRLRAVSPGLPSALPATHATRAQAQASRTRGGLRCSALPQSHDQEADRSSGRHGTQWGRVFDDPFGCGVEREDEGTRTRVGNG